MNGASRIYSTEEICNSKLKVTIQPAQIKNTGLASLTGSQASPSSAKCLHKRPGSAQVEVGETTGTDKIIKVIQLIVELLNKIFGGKNEPGGTQQVPGSQGATTAAEGQNANGSSFIDKLGESILGLFSGAIGKLLG